MAEGKTYRVRVTRGVLVRGEAHHPDGKGGPILELGERDARAVVGARRGEYVNPQDATGPLSTDTAAAAIARRHR